MKKINNVLIVACSVLINTAYSQQPIPYPVAHKSSVEDVYFDVRVPDPYRWLEDDQGTDTYAWVKQQNELTNSYLAKIPFRDTLKQRMTALWNYQKYMPPFNATSRYFYYKNNGLQNQPILFMMKSLQFVPMEYFDPNKISADGTTAITQTVPSMDGKYMAFVLSNSGSDWSEIRIKEVATMKSCPEKIGWVKFSAVAWRDSGFFYSRYNPLRGDENMLTVKNENHKIVYHQLNQKQEEDSLIYEDRNHPLRTFTANTTEDERYLVITGAESTRPPEP